MMNTDELKINYEEHIENLCDDMGSLIDLKMTMFYPEFEASGKYIISECQLTSTAHNFKPIWYDDILKGLKEIYKNEWKITSDKEGHKLIFTLIDLAQTEVVSPNTNIEETKERVDRFEMMDIEE